MRGEKRKASGSLIEAAAAGALKPWREVVTPHPDVASGRYQQAEFAADLWQVHLGEGSDEYRKPGEFFRRTYPHRRPQAPARRRVCTGSPGSGGDPVVKLQTNFGGGKTHSMLALYHLFSGAAPQASSPGSTAVLPEAGVRSLASDRQRVVLVGNKISPGNPVTKPDGTVVRTLWGEFALAARRQEGVRARAPTTKGHQSRRRAAGAVQANTRLPDPHRRMGRLRAAAPRQSDLPAGSFETQFTFAQALTEFGEARPGNCLLVICAAGVGHRGSPHTQADDVEVGGSRGREALDRLATSSAASSRRGGRLRAEEGFEIVRRRLFEPMRADAFKHRDVTARAFSELYRRSSQEFPPECRDADYEKRHPGRLPDPSGAVRPALHRLVARSTSSSAPAACCA